MAQLKEFTLCCGTSVTLWYCIETNAHIVKLYPPSGRGISNRMVKLPLKWAWSGSSDLILKLGTLQ